MSLVFSDTVNYKGIVQKYEKEIGAARGEISGDPDRLKELTADVNAAMDDFVAIAIQASGTWQFDDSNNTDYPIIKTNLVSGQRDYSFVSDQDGNLILDIYKVMILISATGTLYYELGKTDQQTQYSGIDSEITTGTVPYQYDKTANGIFLDPIPNYNATNGLKVYINREPLYFSYKDTTKKPGVPGILHNYFYKKPAQQYAARNNMAIAGGRLRNGAYTGLLMEVKDIEAGIKEYFGHRQKDETPRLVMANWIKNR
jgi:hypothetical protein